MHMKSHINSFFFCGRKGSLRFGHYEHFRSEDAAELPVEFHYCLIKILLLRDEVASGECEA
jgi:hypothetical protein